jgi:hypothetical protein
MITALEYPGKELLKMLAKLPALDAIADSLYSKLEGKGEYLEHLKTSPFYGPYRGYNCFEIMQGKFSKLNTLTNYGWKIIISENKIEFSEVNGDDDIGFCRAVFAKGVLDHDFSKNKNVSTKKRMWYLDETENLQCAEMDFSKGLWKPGF